jgi:hypothetical protein
MMRTRPLIDSAHLDGSSPPGVFVGRIGWPRVYAGPLIPPTFGDTSILDSPEAWGDMSMDDIVAMRSQLVRGMHRCHVEDAREPDRVVALTQELALGRVPADVEATFTRKPSGRVQLDDDVQPFGPSAPLADMEVASVRPDQRLEKASSDDDWPAAPAVVWLYERGLPVSGITRAFSVGLLGVGRRRRLVPTRWSITAVDDTVGKELRRRAQELPLIDEFRVYECRKLDNRFVVVQLPSPWAYELIEAWYPNTVWNPTGREIVMFGDHEGMEGRSTYASIGGCYYAARLATAEALLREGRQAATVILREAHPGYIMPVGVWNVREQVRAALARPPLRFEGLGEALGYASTRLAIPMERWVRNSAVLKDALHQRRIEDFLQGVLRR